MRKTVAFLAALLLLLQGCSMLNSATRSFVENVYLGMPLPEFKALAGNKASLEAMEAGLTVYRMNEYDIYDGHSFVTGAKFFYFDGEGKLFKMDSEDLRENFERMVAIGTMEKTYHNQGTN